jgi:hypothetical protein
VSILIEYFVLPHPSGLGNQGESEEAAIYLPRSLGGVKQAGLPQTGFNPRPIESSRMLTD